ncbi:MAG: hypothetical protein KDA88_19245 [Planctomycetaceae bacterium]|nr:hypothetical protein [Planctomycetaceae bacterium]MCB9953558.1 hypothetical protein [Planctomycetaceae bacterium]
MANRIEDVKFYSEVWYQLLRNIAGEGELQAVRYVVSRIGSLINPMLTHRFPCEGFTDYFFGERVFPESCQDRMVICKINNEIMKWMYEGQGHYPPDLSNSRDWGELERCLDEILEAYGCSISLIRERLASRSDRI